MTSSFGWIKKSDGKWHVYEKVFFGREFDSLEEAKEFISKDPEVRVDSISNIGSIFKGKPLVSKAIHNCYSILKEIE